MRDNPGSRGAVDADSLAADGTSAATESTVAAVAAICTWLGVPAVSSRHPRAARRAIDMTRSIAGSRPPAQTTRGLA